MTPFRLSLNGRDVTAEVEPRTHLADFVRGRLLTGTHLGCEHGVCGACTVLLDGEPARACITYAVACDGADVRTIEGLEDDAVAARLRLAFSAEHALQCGYCTPGMLVTARDIVLRLPDADDDRVRLELAGNLCRCTGYNGIVRAIRRVLNERLEIARPERSAIPAVSFGTMQAEDAPAVPRAQEGLQQRLQFAQPAARVWQALHDPALIAGCIPGAQLALAEPGRIEGQMLVAIGPVRTRFKGAATLTYDETALSGVVQGGGQDQASGTRLNATAQFQVIAEGEASCVLAISVEYGLRGALAHLAHGRVVDLLAGEIAALFARNLAARLDGGKAAAQAPIPAARVMLRMAWVWLRQAIGR